VELPRIDWFSTARTSETETWLAGWWDGFYFIPPRTSYILNTCKSNDVHSAIIVMKRFWQLTPALTWYSLPGLTCKIQKGFSEYGLHIELSKEERILSIYPPLCNREVSYPSSLMRESLLCCLSFNVPTQITRGKVPNGSFEAISPGPKFPPVPNLVLPSIS